MGKFRTYKIKIEFEGYLRLTENQDVENEWSDKLYDEENQQIKSVEILEEYDLKDEMIKYLEDGIEIDEEMEKAIEHEIFSQKKIIKRDNTLGQLLQ